MPEGESKSGESEKPFDPNATGEFAPLDLPAEIAGSETDPVEILKRGREKLKTTRPELGREVEEATKEAIRRNAKKKIS